MESETKKPAFVPKKWPQIAAAFAASVGGLALGATLAWPSPSIPDIICRDALPNLSADDASWIVAIVPLGALLSGPVAGFAIEKVGRKRTLLLLTLPFVASNLVVAFSSTLTMMLIGRFLSGFCTGLATLAAPVYIAEIATNALRGTLGSIFNAFLTIGTVATFLLIKLTNWVGISIIHAGVPIVLLIGMLLVPESPIYLLMKGNTKEARKSYKWLRGADTEDQIEPELQFVKQRLEEMKAKAANVTYRDLFQHGTWQPIAIALTLVTYNQMSGITAIISYSKQIVESTGSGLDPDVVTAVVGSVVLVSTFFMDMAGRRILLFISSTGMALSFAVIGVFYYLKEDKQGSCIPNSDPLCPSKDSTSTPGYSTTVAGETCETLEGAITWMPLIALLFYNLTYNLGVGPLPRVISTEILPQRVRGMTLGITMALNWTLAFAVTKTFSQLITALKESGYFWLFAGINATGLIFTFFFVPETRGKSMADIENNFLKRKNKAPEISIISEADINANVTVK